jgi:hypothetical protein
MMGADNRVIELYAIDQGSGVQSGFLAVFDPIIHGLSCHALFLAGHQPFLENFGDYYGLSLAS